MPATMIRTQIMKRFITVTLLAFAAIIAALSFTTVGIAGDQPVAETARLHFERQPQSAGGRAKAGAGSAIPAYLR